MADQVSDLKLQHLVELSKLGDGCAELESQIDAWLGEHDVVFDGHTIPFVLMPHFVSPGQVRRVRRVVECLSAVLNRFCATSDATLTASPSLIIDCSPLMAVTSRFVGGITLTATNKKQ